MADTVKRQASRLKDAAGRKLDQQFTGRLSSGAAARQKAKALGEIDIQTQDKLAGLAYEDSGKEREERLLKEQQAFSAGEAQKQREFGTSERLGVQDFQSKQSELDRLLQQQNINLGYEQLRTQQQQFATEFEENVRTGLFNKIVALKDIEPQVLDRILSMLGRGDISGGFDESEETKQYLGGLTGIPTVSTKVPQTMILNRG